MLAVAGAWVLGRLRRGAGWAALLVLLAAAALAAGVSADVWSWQAAGLRPEASGQGATVFGLMSMQAFMTSVALLMAGYLVVRVARGLVSPARSSTVHLIALYIAYAGLQGALGAAVVRLFPGAG